MPCTYADREGQLRRRLRHAGRAREPRRPALAADRACRSPASAPAPRTRASPSSASRAVPASPTCSSRRRAASPTDHDVVLVGYRGVDGSSGSTAPRSSRRSKHSADFLGARSFARLRATPFARCATRLQADGVDLAGYTLPERVDDLEAARTRPRLPPHRPAQRERRHAHGDDLRLALPEEHPPLGDDRREPARPLPLVPRRRPTRRSAVRRALREGRELQLAHRRPRRIDARRRRRHARATGGSCRSRRATCGSRSFFGLMDVARRAAPLSAPMTFDSWLAAAERRRERLLAAVAAGELIFPKSFVWGDLAAVGARRRRRRESATSRGRLQRRARSSATRAPTSSGRGGRLAHAWPATPTTTSTAACGPRTCRRS